MVIPVTALASRRSVVILAPVGIALLIIAALLDGATVRKVIVVPAKMVNFVVG